jgi:hypothetical protein
LQEYRVALETLPGVAASLEVLDKIHDEVEVSGNGFINTSIISLEPNTEAVTIVIFLDAITGLIALGSAANIATRALSAVGITIPAIGFNKIEAEITDFVPATVAWPAYETDADVQRPAPPIHHAA